MTWKKPPPRVRQYEGVNPSAPRAPGRKVVAVERPIVAVPKDEPKRSRPYREWVASLPCARCGVLKYSQAAHPNGQGKGMGIKACDSLVFPLCCVRPIVLGCHYLLDQHLLGGRAEEQVLEARWTASTQALARYSGRWPKDWP